MPGRSQLPYAPRSVPSQFRMVCLPIGRVEGAFGVTPPWRSPTLDTTDRQHTVSWYEETADNAGPERELTTIPTTTATPVCCLNHVAYTTIRRLSCLVTAHAGSWQFEGRPITAHRDVIGA